METVKYEAKERRRKKVTVETWIRPWSYQTFDVEALATIIIDELADWAKAEANQANHIYKEKLHLSTREAFSIVI